MRNVYLLLAFLLITLKPTLAQQCNIHPPSNLSASDVTSCSATLHWTPGTNSEGYKVRYKLSSSSAWSRVLSVASGTSYTFTGLQKSVSYDLAVASVCTDGTKSIFKMITVVTGTCTQPSSVTVAITGSTSAKITLSTTCPFDTAYVRYWKAGQSGAKQYLKTTSTTFELSGLITNTSYVYQVTTCPRSFNNWTTADTFVVSTLPKPNILFILMDDSRFDYFSCNGAPSFFQTPSIDRIANEGVNFKNNFVVYSLCAPSRASILTGMYPVRTRVVDNHTQENLNPDLAIIPGLIHDNGYYTAFLGKNDSLLRYTDHYYDYWFESTSEDNVVKKHYNYNGVSKKINGLTTDVLTDSAVKIIENVNQPFFMWLAYKATHAPLVPAPGFEGLYDNYTMPLNTDTAIYSSNYPSFLYTLQSYNYKAGDSVMQLYRNTYEVMAQVDSDINRMLQALESTGKLDNTVIIFTSDNGHLFGEHHLYMKRHAYDPSMRVPLFIRYPAWFPTPAVVTNNMTLNVDLGPTFLEAAGVDDTFHLDGISVHDLYSGSATRSEVYYHSFYTTESQYSKLPYAKAVRDFNYKYIYHGCFNDTTEEFFDLKNDSLEINNLVNNSAYDSLVQVYRNKLAVLALQYGDTANETRLNCYIANPQNVRAASTDSYSDGFMIYPNPADAAITIYFPSAINAEIEVRNELGVVTFRKQLKDGEHMVQLDDLSAGVYFISFLMETPFKQRNSSFNDRKGLSDSVKLLLPFSDYRFFKKEKAADNF